MSKFELIASPTFKAKVGFPKAGGETIDIELTFRHRTKKALDEFIKTRADKTDVESFLDMVSGWELDDEFTPGNVELLLENFIGVALATFERYLEELTKHRRGN